MPTQQPAINAFYGALAADTGAGGVSTLTAARIYEGQAPEAAAIPSVILNLVDDVPVESFTTSDLNATLQVDVYGDRFAGSAVARTIADRLVTLLHRTSLSITGWNGGQVWCLDRGTLNIEDDAYRIMQTWRVTASTT